MIEGRTRLYDGDRLVIGGSHYFRVSNSNCERRRATGQSCDPVDFQWAHQEILAQQERKLREELEQEKQAALQQIRAHQQAAEEEFAERLQSLEIEKHQIKCSKELLENEVAIYKRQTQREGDVDGGPYKSGYQSTLLEDIQRMMSRPTKESLHQIQMKVKEATQRCRAFKAPFEFRQTQKADPLGIFHAVVTIIDREHSKVAEWPPARLDVWLEMVREADFDQNQLFQFVETEWLDWDEVDMNLEESFGGGGGAAGDSLNSSRIGLNLSAMREKLMRVATVGGRSGGGGSPQRQLTPLVVGVKSVLKEPSEERKEGGKGGGGGSGVKKMLTYEDEENEGTRRRVLVEENGQRSGGKDRRRMECIAVELKDLQQGTHRLKKLVMNGEAVQEVQKKALNVACREIERQLAVIKGVLGRGGEECKGGEVVKTPKSVRFLLD